MSDKTKTTAEELAKRLKRAFHKQARATIVSTKELNKEIANGTAKLVFKAITGERQ